VYWSTGIGEYIYIHYVLHTVVGVSVNVDIVEYTLLVLKAPYCLVFGGFCFCCSVVGSLFVFLICCSVPRISSPLRVGVLLFLVLRYPVLLLLLMCCWELSSTRKLGNSTINKTPIRKSLLI
jgi:hypothetical protein